MGKEWTRAARPANNMFLHMLEGYETNGILKKGVTCIQTGNEKDEGA